MDECGPGDENSDCYASSPDDDANVNIATGDPGWLTVVLGVGLAIFCLLALLHILTEKLAP